MDTATTASPFCPACHQGVTFLDSCPLHRVAPAMLAALQEAEPHIRGLGSAHALAAVRAAIRAARSEN